MELVHRPLSPIGTVNPTLIDPDRLARAHARREVKTLNADLVIARARRMARRALPEIASLPCGCNREEICSWAAQRYLDMWDAPPEEALRAADEFLKHRQPLFPRGFVRPRLSEAGVKTAKEQVRP